MTQTCYPSYSLVTGIVYKRVIVTLSVLKKMIYSKSVKTSDIQSNYQAFSTSSYTPSSTNSAKTLIDVFYVLHSPLPPSSRDSRGKKCPGVRFLEGNAEVKDLSHIHKLDNQSLKYWKLIVLENTLNTL